MKRINIKSELTINIDTGIIRFINNNYNTREQLINCCMSSFNLLKHQLDKQKEDITDIEALDCFADMSNFQMKLYLSELYNYIDIGKVGNSVDLLIETINKK